MQTQADAGATRGSVQASPLTLSGWGHGRLQREWEVQRGWAIVAALAILSLIRREEMQLVSGVSDWLSALGLAAGWLWWLVAPAAIGSREIADGNEEWEWALPVPPAERYRLRLLLLLAGALWLLGIQAIILWMQHYGYWSVYWRGLTPSDWIVLAAAAMGPLLIGSAGYAAASNTYRSPVLLTVAVVTAWAGWQYFDSFANRYMGNDEVGLRLGVLILVTATVGVAGALNYRRREAIVPGSLYVGWVSRALIALIVVAFLTVVWDRVSGVLDPPEPEYLPMSIR